MAKRVKPERQLQKAVGDGLNAALPFGSLWFAIPNGGSRNVIEASNMKKFHEVTAGVPDLCIIQDGKTVFVELKAGKNNVSASQKIFIPKLREAGIQVSVCRSLDEVYAFLKSEGFELKARVA